MKPRFTHPTTIWLVQNHDYYDGRCIGWTATKPEQSDFIHGEYRKVAIDKATKDCIWLQPWCAVCEEIAGGTDDGRLWCDDDVWGNCDIVDECRCLSIPYMKMEEQ